MGGGKDRLRARSKALFGSKYRLEVARAVAQADPAVVFAREIAEELGIADALVQSELRHFEAAELLDRLDRPRGQQVQYYQRRESPFWDLALELAREGAKERMGRPAAR